MSVPISAYRYKNTYSHRNGDLDEYIGYVLDIKTKLAPKVHPVYAQRDVDMFLHDFSKVFELMTGYNFEWYVNGALETSELPYQRLLVMNILFVEKMRNLRLRRYLSEPENPKVTLREKIIAMKYYYGAPEYI